MKSATRMLLTLTLSVVFLEFNLFASSFAFAHGPLDEQIASLTRQIELYPDSAALYLERGELHRHHQDWPSALADYHCADSLDSSFDLAELCRGRMLLDAGWLEKARSALDEFLTKHPNDGEGLLTRARALVQLAEHLAAARDYGKAIKNLQTPQPEYFLECAQAFENAGLEHFQAALQIIDDGVRQLGQVVTLELFAIELEVKLQRYDAALARLEKVAAQSARKEKWLLRRGEILRMAGREDEARRTFALALKEIDSLPSARRYTKSMVDLEKRLRGEL